MQIDFKCPEGTQKNDCEVTDHGAYDSVEVDLVDKNEKDLDIVKGEADREEEIADEICDIKLDNCDFEIDVPNDIDEGKYKFIIEAKYDEGSAFFINKVKIKE